MLEHWGDACYLISRSHVGTGTFLGRLPWLMISIWRLMGAFENGPFTSERVGNSNETTTTKSHGREMLKSRKGNAKVTLFTFGCFFLMSKKANLERPWKIPIQRCTETNHPTVGGGSSRRTYLGCLDEDGNLAASWGEGMFKRYNIQRFNKHSLVCIYIYRERERFFHISINSFHFFSISHQRLPRILKLTALRIWRVLQPTKPLKSCRAMFIRSLGHSLKGSWQLGG